MPINDPIAWLIICILGALLGAGFWIATVGDEYDDTIGRSRDDD